jgi:hypothetical protein
LSPNISTSGASPYHMSKYMAGMLGSHLDNYLHRVRNSAHSICKLGSPRAGPQDIMWSHSSLGCQLVGTLTSQVDVLEKNNRRLFQDVLTSPFFSFGGQFYEDGRCGCGGFATVLSNFQLLYGEFLEDGTRQGYPLGYTEKKLYLL